MTALAALPSHCWWCGAYLMGSWTTHERGCRLLELIDAIVGEGPMPVTIANVDDVFTYHAPEAGQPAQYQNIRLHAKALAAVILTETPACADQQAAIRLLREAVMTANAAIALKGAV